MTSEEADDEDILVNASSPVPPALAFGVAMTLGAFALFLHVPTSFLHLSRGFDVVRAIGFALVVLAAIPRKVHIGAEAIRIRWVGSTRVIRYDDVVRAAPLGHDVVIVLRGGVGLRLHPPIFGTQNRVTTRALERIWKTMAAGAEAVVRGAERAILVRGARSPADWVKALRDLVPQGAQYRRAIDHGRLWTLVENPALEVELRIAAAVALWATFDDEARTRLRAVARTTSERGLRDALSRIADATDENDLENAALRASVRISSPEHDG